MKYLINYLVILITLTCDLSAQDTDKKPLQKKDLLTKTEHKKENYKLIELPDLEVITDKPTTAASSRRVRSRDLKLRPITNPTEILQVAPGLITARHAGGGKATQYFIRGFDIDHGTDLALSVDGMPINMVSHGHGQGYADVHFLIPEVYEELLVRKGPYFADVGDFATAGALEFKSKQEVNENFVSFRTGMFNSHRVLWLHQIKSDIMQPIMAVETHLSDGAFDNPEKLKRMNVFFKNSFVTTKDTQWSLTAMGYASKWNASSQIPERAVKSGLISRFGTIDNSEGGSTQRFSLSSNYSQSKKNKKFDFNAYLIKYNFNLFSNFTFFKDDPINGDQIAQFDRRTIIGTEAKHTIFYNLLDFDSSTIFGARIRTDMIENELYRSKARKLIQPKTRSEITQSNLSSFFEERITFFSWMRFVGGLRAEYFVFEVNDHLEDKGTLTTATSTTTPISSGQTDGALLLPKANLIFSPIKTWEIYLNFGMSFHSNDARGTVIQNDPNKNPVQPLTKATGYEVGSRIKLFDKLDLAVATWLLDLESEIVWIGDEGTTEPSGRSRRFGIDLELRLQILRWLFIDTDATINTAQFRDNPGNANSIALAPKLTVTGGLTIDNLSGLSVSVRGRHIGKRPANETGSLTAQDYFVLDASIIYRYKKIEFFSNVKNMTNTNWKEVQFATESQLQNESNPVEEIHFVSGSPFYFETGVRYFF